MNGQPKKFYYQFDDSVVGPMTGIDLRESAFAGNVKPTTLVANAPEGPWVEASHIRGLFDANGRPMPHPPGARQFRQESQSGSQAQDGTDINTAIQPEVPASISWFYQFQGQVIGPLTVLQLQEAVAAGHVSPTTLVANDPNLQWWVASDVSGLFVVDGTRSPILLQSESNQQAQYHDNDEKRKGSQVVADSTRSQALRQLHRDTRSKQWVTIMIAIASISGLALILWKRVADSTLSNSTTAIVAKPELADSGVALSSHTPTTPDSTTGNTETSELSGAESTDTLLLHMSTQPHHPKQEVTAAGQDHHDTFDGTREPRSDTTPTELPIPKDSDLVAAIVERVLKTTDATYDTPGFGTMRFGMHKVEIDRRHDLHPDDERSNWWISTDGMQSFVFDDDKLVGLTVLFEGSYERSLGELLLQFGTPNQDQISKMLIVPSQSNGGLAYQEDRVRYCNESTVIYVTDLRRSFGGGWQQAVDLWVLDKTWVRSRMKEMAFERLVALRRVRSLMLDLIASDVAKSDMRRLNPFPESTRLAKEDSKALSAKWINTRDRQLLIAEAPEAIVGSSYREPVATVAVKMYFDAIDEDSRSLLHSNETTALNVLLAQSVFAPATSKIVIRTLPESHAREFRWKTNKGLDISVGYTQQNLLGLQEGESINISWD